jgi:hypothetical protein
MLKHRCAALMIFHDAETPLCSTVHFSDAETPLKNTGDCFPDAETPLFGTFHFFPFTKTSQPAIPPSFSLPKQLRPALVSLSPPSSAATPFAATFPVAETPATFHFPPVAETLIVSNFSSVFPMLKHHYSAFFISFHHIIFSHPPSSTKQFRPTIVSPLLLLKHHLPATLHHSSMMLKHHRSAPSDFLPILKHQLSAVLHL